MADGCRGARPLGPVHEERLPRGIPRRIHWVRAGTERWLLAWRRSARDKIPFPAFLGIGAQKAGTSWLHANLRAHPDLFLPAQKEVHYFDRLYYFSVYRYAAVFAEAGSRMAGEFTPAYALLPEQRIRFIARMNPNLRILFMLRDPVARAWSHALMNLVRKTGRALEDVPEGEMVRHFRSERSRRRGDYLETLDRWGEHFAPDQFFIGFFEDIQLRPKELLSSVFRHLGAEPPSSWAGYPVDKVIFKGPANPIPEQYRTILCNIHASDLEALESRFGERAEGWREQR